MKRLYCLITLLSLLAGCRGNKPQEILFTGGQVESLTRIDVPFATLDLVDGMKADYDDLVEEIKYLQLGNEKGLIGQIQQMLYYNGRYYIYDKAQDMVFIFDGTTGECIHKINSKGRGSKEYLAIANIDINKENNELILKDRLQNQVLFYDLDGNYKYSRTISVEDSATLSLVDTTLIHRVETQQNLNIDELKGYGILISAGDSIVGKGFIYLPSQIGYGSDSANINKGYDDVIYYRPLCSDSIYRINPDMTYSVAWHAKLKESRWERNSKSETFAFDANSDKTGGEFITSWFYESRDFFVGYARLKPRGEKMDFYVYDKTKSTTYITQLKEYNNITKLDRFWGYDIYCVYGDYFVSSADISIIEEIKEKVKNGTMEVTDPELKKIIDNIGYNDNPVLILTKFKSL